MAELTDQCTECGTLLEDTCQERHEQVLEENDLSPGSYNVIREGEVLAGWCPACRNTQRQVRWHDGTASEPW